MISGLTPRNGGCPFLFLLYNIILEVSLDKFFKSLVSILVACITIGLIQGGSGRGSWDD